MKVDHGSRSTAKTRQRWNLSLGTGCLKWCEVLIGGDFIYFMVVFTEWRGVVVNMRVVMCVSCE